MNHQRGHVLILPHPSQGHINPLFQFGKCLANHDLLVTLAITRYILATTLTDPNPGPLTIAPISDGFDDGGYGQADSIPTYIDRLESAGSETLAALIESCRAESRPVSVLVYDAFLPWALDVGKRLGIKCAAFFTQSCAVSAIYSHVRAGRLSWPAEAAVELPGLPLLKPGDMPSYLTDPVPGPYLPYFHLLLNQFSNLDGADVVLFNTFYELESKSMEGSTEISLTISSCCVALQERPPICPQLQVLSLCLSASVCRSRSLFSLISHEISLKRSHPLAKEMTHNCQDLTISACVLT